jgi:hypothetical protein
MRKIAALIAAVAAFGLVAFGLNTASAAPPKATLIAAPVHALAEVGAVACIAGNDPHHNVKVFWTPGRVCPSGHYGIADAFSGTPGPKGDKGDKGDAGDSNVVSRKASVTLTSASVAQTVTVSGLPAFSTGMPEIATNNLDARPIGSSVVVTALPVAAGDVVRKFSVSAPSGLGTNSFNLQIQVVDVP